jgi:peptide/nickel transport system permease protein
MLRYVLKRLLIFLPTLLVISLLSFGLSKVAPGDPVDLVLRGGLGAAEGSGGDIRNRERVYQETAAFLGVDKPSFYFALTAAAYPDTLHRIVQKDRRETLRKLIAQYGNWPQIAAYYQALQTLEYELFQIPDARRFEGLGIVRSNVRTLYLQHRDPPIRALLDSTRMQLQRDTTLKNLVSTAFENVQQRYDKIVSNATPQRLLIPTVHWYGTDNQYHKWIVGFFQGKFGISYADGRPVAHKIYDALYWTVVMNGISILIAYLLSIPIGVLSAVYKDTRLDRITTITLFVLYSLPTFWIATMLVVFFTTPEYGMDWFPTMGVGDVASDTSLWQRLRIRGAHLILPIFCITYGSLAFISRQMRGAMLDVLRQDYIRTARAKGLSEQHVIWRHAFRNALFPIITLFASIFPAALAGSVVIEAIFNIPGMGKLSIDAINSRDFPVVYTVLMLSAVLTMVGILIADILYALLDPRVSYSK